MTADAVGGVWQYATDLAGELGSAGHRVTLALLGPPPSQVQREQAAEIPGLRLIETGLPLDWLSQGPQPVQAAAEEIARIAAHRPLTVAVLAEVAGLRRPNIDRYGQELIDLIRTVSLV